jgi:hypothetical protein
VNKTPDRHCERSEAIQSLEGKLDCFVASLLATTEGSISFQTGAENPVLNFVCEIFALSFAPGSRSMAAIAMLSVAHDFHRDT